MHNLSTEKYQLSEAEIQQQYAVLQTRMQNDAPLTLLHIGSQNTLVISGVKHQPISVQLLHIGSDKTAADYFHHQPPTPDEMENAIMAVEDEVIRIRASIPDGAQLCTTDLSIRDMALIAGLAEQAELSMSLDTMERTFDRLASVMLGRPAASEGIPEENSFAARLLILREFMHHLAFPSIAIMKQN
ncbi:hypothetical protein I2494_07435 [Budviciaceae bacterium BWR-B9]|uniref:Ppx/GppA phosphatase domain-containing protein n=1 Tax=Limnobaculum allomyrinae TaxID=2791986 RepID=A0ABS1IPT4_9GAMM|nr:MULTISPECIES: hypothetical protein [Limnobaculum]MBK5143551.1 hypothetical protein [Limnobaculum allomyrinae]MBV7691439.1 hypothetical protein [Limnobaculum sp. M2-1]